MWNRNLSNVACSPSRSAWLELSDHLSVSRSLALHSFFYPCFVVVGPISLGGGRLTHHDSPTTLPRSTGEFCRAAQAYFGSQRFRTTLIKCHYDAIHIEYNSCVCVCVCVCVASSIQQNTSIKTAVKIKQNSFEKRDGVWTVVHSHGNMTKELQQDEEKKSLNRELVSH